MSIESSKFPPGFRCKLDRVSERCGCRCASLRAAETSQHGAITDGCSKAIGYGLIAGGLVYLVGSVTRFVAPRYLSTLEPAYAIPLIAELAFCLWLLFHGVRPPVSDTRAN